MLQLLKQSKMVLSRSVYLILGLCITGFYACAGDPTARSGENPTTVTPAKDTSIKLPAGFTATTISEGLSRPRHIAVTGNGIIYVKLAKLKDGRGIYKLDGKNGDGAVDKATGFGNFAGDRKSTRLNSSHLGISYA